MPHRSNASHESQLIVILYFLSDINQLTFLCPALNATYFTNVPNGNTVNPKTRVCPINEAVCPFVCLTNSLYLMKRDSQRVDISREDLISRYNKKIFCTEKYILYLFVWNPQCLKSDSHLINCFDFID